MTVVDKQQFLEHLFSYGLYLFPTHTILEDNETGDRFCSCKNGKSCNSPGKHPLLSLKWKDCAAPTLTKFNALAKRANGNNNFALCTGRWSKNVEKYLIVVDFDCETHELLDTLPKTFRYRTGSGGHHLWFWSNVPLKNSVSVLSNKVDIRGTGGYVIIPPSKHISGKSYSLDCDFKTEIADLPQSIIDNINSKIKDNLRQIGRISKVRNDKKQSTEISSNKEIQNLDETVMQWWSKETIPNLRMKINSGTLIPLGVRNVVLHRLLSSDRAKGAATKEELILLAEGYRTNMKNSESFSDEEMLAVIKSVMKYSVYNNNFETVNKNYSTWIEKRSKGTILVDENSLNAMDNNFFSQLKVLEKGGTSLAHISFIRDEWFKSKGFKNHSTYKIQLLAKKLTSLGFEKKRTAKFNTWNVDLTGISFDDSLPEEIKLPTKNVVYPKKRDRACTSTTSCAMMSLQSPNERENIMSDNTETNSTENTELNENPEASKYPKYFGPDGKPLKFVRVHEEVVKTKTKYHPNDDRRYRGKVSSQEYLRSLTLFLNELTPEQNVLFGRNELLYDQERTCNWIENLQIGDVIGLAHSKYILNSIDPETYTLTCQKYNLNTKTGESVLGDTVEISIYDVDNNLSLGFGEILYRNNVPFGVDEDMTYRIVLTIYSDDKGRFYTFKEGKRIFDASGQDIAAKTPSM